MSGYHTLNIEKGKYGKFSKIREEFEELIDAHKQKDKILILCELADLIGAIEAYSENKFDCSLNDLKKFSDKTKGAFKDGSR